MGLSVASINMGFSAKLTKTRGVSRPSSIVPRGLKRLYASIVSHLRILCLQKRSKPSQFILGGFFFAWKGSKKGKKKASRFFNRETSAIQMGGDPFQRSSRIQFHFTTVRPWVNTKKKSLSLRQARETFKISKGVRKMPITLQSYFTMC
jgi:hypothetical protein